MSDTPPSQPRSVLAVLGVLALVAAVVAGAVLLAQRASDRTASDQVGETASPTDQAPVEDAPTPSGGGGGELDDLGELPTINPSDFPTTTAADDEPAGLPTSFPTDLFPSKFPTDEAGWEEWASEQMEQVRP